MDAIELLKKARAGDRQARDRMVEENVGLVWNIVKRFNGRGYDRSIILIWTLRSGSVHTQCP